MHIIKTETSLRLHARDADALSSARCGLRLVRCLLCLAASSPPTARLIAIKAKSSAKQGSSPFVVFEPRRYMAASSAVFLSRPLLPVQQASSPYTIATCSVFDPASRSTCIAFFKHSAITTDGRSAVHRRSIQRL